MTTQQKIIKCNHGLEASLDANDKILVTYHGIVFMHRHSPEETRKQIDDIIEGLYEVRRATLILDPSNANQRGS